MKYYLTAAIPYVNAKPHLGYAMELIQGDVMARFHRQKGDEVFYIYGADENSLKNFQAAEKEGISVKSFCDRNAKAFFDLGKLYNISFDNFQRSSSPEHFKSAQELWKKCEASGDIYKKKYKGLYCVGCEAFYTKEELNEKGECLEHPGKKLDEVEEENYFFKLSKYEGQIKKAIESDAFKIVPETRKNEALGLIKQGLQDFSISRSKERAHGWGVPVPGDDTQIMYVWFDALNVYRDAAPEKFWPADLHIIGKGIFRFHAIYWPGILLSAKLALPKELFIHGYVTLNGQKISKSLGNVIDPIELANKYGIDAVRYYLLREIPSDEDGDFSEEKFKIRYNADLANGIGNFASRVLTLSEKLGALNINHLQDVHPETKKELATARNTTAQRIESRKFHEALGAIWQLISYGDKFMNDQKPWAVENKGSSAETLTQLVLILDEVAHLLAPFLPKTAEQIIACIKHDKKTENIISVKKISALFPRL